MRRRTGLLSYKILLITRDRLVLSDLPKILFEIKPLGKEEADELFEKITTYRAKSRSLPFYAEEICKKCNGLTIALVTLAKALRSGNLKPKTILQKLLQSDPNLLHSASCGSYDCLKSSKLQRTFLLCGLMGHNAAVQDLLKGESCKLALKPVKWC
ncbi:hypothetical protein SLE2022_057990 [Rubroshorea leprosula]